VKLSFRSFITATMFASVSTFAVACGTADAGAEADDTEAELVTGDAGAVSFEGGPSLEEQKFISYNALNGNRAPCPSGMVPTWGGCVTAPWCPQLFYYVPGRGCVPTKRACTANSRCGRG